MTADRAPLREFCVLCVRVFVFGPRMATRARRRMCSTQWLVQGGARCCTHSPLAACLVGGLLAQSGIDQRFGLDPEALRGRGANCVVDSVRSSWSCVCVCVCVLQCARLKPSAIPTSTSTFHNPRKGFTYMCIDQIDAFTMDTNHTRPLVKPHMIDTRARAHLSLLL